MIVWANAYVLYFLVPVLLCAAVLLVRRYVWQKRTAGTLGGDVSLKNFSLSKKLLKTVLLLLGFLFLLLALARPQWGSKKQTVAQEGRDVLIALDISRSMLAQDRTPSRLALAKEKIKQLLARLTAERVSLMVFSGIALVQCPFTSDIAAFTNFLDLADAEAISSGTTSLGKAVTLAIDTFNAVPDRKNRLMVLFSDGEDFSGNLDAVAEHAKNEGLRIFTVGVGTPEGAPIPLYTDQGEQEGHQKDAEGNIVITRLDEARLAELSHKTGAEYVRMTENDNDINQLVADIQRFDKEKFDDKTFDVQHDRYMIFAGLSLACFLLEWLL